MDWFGHYGYFLVCFGTDSIHRLICIFLRHAYLLRAPPPAWRRRLPFHYRAFYRAFHAHICGLWFVMATFGAWYDVAAGSLAYLLTDVGLATHAITYAMPHFCRTVHRTTTPSPACAHFCRTTSYYHAALFGAAAYTCVRICGSTYPVATVRDVATTQTAIPLPTIFTFYLFLPACHYLPPLYLLLLLFIVTRRSRTVYGVDGSLVCGAWRGSRT